MNDEERRRLLTLILDYGIEEYYAGMEATDPEEPLKFLQAIVAVLFPEDQP